MKQILLTITALCIGACGAAEHQGQYCSGDLRELCYNIFGGRKPASTATEIAEINRQLSSLDNDIYNIRALLASRGAEIATLSDTIATVRAEIVAGDSAAVTSLLVLEAQLLQLQNQQSQQQNELEDHWTAIATLQGYTNIVAIKDPCGRDGNFDEVLLKLSSGQYLVSFSDNSSGKNTRFTLLRDGNFQTTDGSYCSFSVRNNGTEVYNEHH